MSGKPWWASEADPSDPNAPIVVDAVFRVGRSYRCRVKIPAAAAGAVIYLDVQWSPRPPDRPLSRCERRDYRRGLDNALREAARLTGLPMIHAEL
jgi:hypothetical protein